VDGWYTSQLETFTVLLEKIAVEREKNRSSNTCVKTDDVML
jgi:hypothetical protein